MGLFSSKPKNVPLQSDSNNPGLQNAGNDSNEIVAQNTPVFSIEKVSGNIAIDFTHGLFQTKGGVPHIPKKTGGLMKAAKATAAVATLGTSVVAEKAVKFATKQDAPIFSFEELRGFDLLEDDSSVSSGGLGRAVVGGVLFGGVGAVVGGVTGKKKAKKVVDSLVLRVDLNNPSIPCIMIPFIKKSVKTKSSEYTRAYDAAQQSIAALGQIISMVEQRKQQQQMAMQAQMNAQAMANASQGQSPIEQVKQLKELLDMGVISQDEFDMKKKQLLGL